MIILRVADTNDVVGGQAKAFEGAFEAPCLVDVAGQDYHGALVKNDVQFKTELANDIEHDLLVRLPCGDNGAANRVSGATPISCRRTTKAGGGGSARAVSSFFAGLKRSSPFSAITRSNRPSCGNARCKSGRIPAGDQKHLATRPFDFLQRLNGRAVDRAVQGKGADELPQFWNIVTAQVGRQR